VIVVDGAVAAQVAADVVAVVNVAEQQQRVVVDAAAAAAVAFCPFCDMLPAYDEDRDTRYFSVDPGSMSNAGI
jgi:hypothetical protein